MTEDCLKFDRDTSLIGMIVVEEDLWKNEVFLATKTSTDGLNVVRRNPDPRE